MKQIYLLILVLGMGFLSAAQNRVELNFINQYKQPLKNMEVLVNNVSNHTDKEGNISFADALKDSLLITVEGYTDKKILPENSGLKQTVVLHKKFSWTDLLTPMFYILYGGIWLLLFIIFAETGLFVGFFFPGDSLLFVAGILSTPLVDSISLNTGNDFINLLIISSLCILAGILGNSVGYFTGRKVGPAMFNWRDRLLFKKKYLYQAKDFYEKHGGGAIVFARFLPFIRTFAPIVAGIVAMDKKKFTFFNIIGCVAWVTSMLFIGHYLNAFTKKQFGLDLEKHLELIVIGIVLVTTAPVLFKLFFGKRKTEPTS
ncbi:MAG: VTT domain-containing protein [Ferruginibacter sp.]